MKLYIKYAFVVTILFFLFGCSKSTLEDDFLYDQPGVVEEEITVPTQTTIVSLSPEPDGESSMVSTPDPVFTEDLDYFVYTVVDDERKIILYDLAQGTQHELFRDDEADWFQLISKDKISFGKLIDGRKMIYVSTYPFTKENHRIVFEINDTCNSIGWSPSGQFLSYFCREGGKEKLYVWNGSTSFPIYESDTYLREFEWSYDNRLAFIETEIVDSKHYGEVYIWNGLETLNVSQNPEKEDRGPTWSEDGKLAFLSDWHDDYDIFVWDGHALKDGEPDRDAYINISSDATEYFSFPEWKSNNELSFTGFLPEDLNKGYDSTQIYLWNSSELTNVSQNKEVNCGGGRWSGDGYLSYIVMYGGTLYILDDEENLVLQTNGQYTAAWGDGGNLIYCGHSDKGWTLNLWDRKQIIEIDNGGHIYGQWPNGESVVCSSG